MKYLFLAAATGMILSCTKPGSTELAVTPLDQLYEDYKAFIYFSYPEYATYDGVHDYNDRLTDQSMKAGEAFIDSIKSFRQSLLAAGREGRDREAQLNYDLFLFSLDQTLDNYSFEQSHYLGFNQQNGYHITFPQIVEVQPLSSDGEIEDYFSRLKGFREQAGHIIAMLEEGRTKGMTLPCPVSDQVLLQLEGFASMKIEDSPFYQAKDKSEALAARESELKAILESDIFPAYKEMYEYYRDKYHGACRQDPGISSLEGGKEYYEYLVRHNTTSDLSPDEVYNLGTQEVERILQEMDKIKMELGYGDLPRADFFKLLRTSSEYYFTDKEDLMAGYREILAEMDTKLPQLFGKLPKAPYNLKEMEEYRAAAAPAAYYYPVPADGSRPGYFYVNTYKLNSRPKFSMTALALHEAVPGHHLQMALANELENVPWFRNNIHVTAFIEGWGLYAEYLGYEADMYEDPLQKMGALSFEMWRACRLVVDVGLHYKGWTKQQALDFMRDHAPLSELDINSEIDRYISWPGQALAYKVGELKIKSLRTSAQERLGDAFDIREFHDIILQNGSIPLGILEERVESWIQEKQKA